MGGIHFPVVYIFRELLISIMFSTHFIRIFSIFDLYVIKKYNTFIKASNGLYGGFMDFNEVLKIFCDKFNLSVPLSNRAQNALYEIKINGKDELYLLENEDRTGVCLYSILFPALNEYKDKISSKINELNAFGKVTKTAVISYSKDDRAFLLSEQFAYENLQKEYFIKRIAEFYTLVNYFKEQWPKWQIEALTTSEKNEKRPTGKQIISP